MDPSASVQSNPSAIRARDHALALAVLAALAGLAMAQGGYFPSAWGATSVLLLWALAAGVLLLPPVRRTGLETTALGALGALVVLTALSAAWSIDPAGSAHEAERGLAYLAGLASLLVFMRRSSVTAALAGVTVAATLAALYALATWWLSDLRSAPSEPIGYSPALALLAAMGALLALGFAVRGDGALQRALAAAALVPLASAVALAGSRTAFVALAVGWAAACIMDPRRRETAGPALALAVPAVVAAVLSATAGAGSGGKAAAGLILLAGASAALTLASAPGRGRAGAVALVLVVAAAWAASLPDDSPARPAPPAFDGRRAGDSIDARLRIWEVAWRSARERPLLGSGAGSYGRIWAQQRTRARTVRDAHNLYLETLAELGLAGLALLLLVPAAALLAALRARGRPLVPYAASALTAYLVHASAHWDWELPVLTLAALTCVAALLVSARGEPEERSVRAPGRAALCTAILALSGVGLAGLAGNSAVERSRDAVAAGALDQAAGHARSAARWQPWSGEPWRLLGAAAMFEGDLARARAELRRGLERDPRNWTLWSDLAAVSTGGPRRAARSRARALNPLHMVDARAAGR